MVYRNDTWPAAATIRPPDSRDSTAAPFQGLAQVGNFLPQRAQFYVQVGLDVLACRRHRCDRFLVLGLAE